MFRFTDETSGERESDARAITIADAFKFIGLDETAARRAASTLLLISMDPVTFDYHKVVSHDKHRIREAVGRARSGTAAPLFRDETLAAIFSTPGSVDEVARACDRLVKRLPGIVAWYDESGRPAEALRVRELQESLEQVLRWV